MSVTTEYFHQQFKLSEDQPNTFILYSSQSCAFNWGYPGVSVFTIGYFECMHDQKATDL